MSSRPKGETFPPHYPTGLSVKLHYREYGNPITGKPALVLLHGLFGSAINWHTIAKQLADEHHVVVPDLRNHGQSPHDDDVSYPSMAGDVLELLDELRIEQACLVGHSMGAKVAMCLALEHGERVAGLVSVDMAPVRYPDHFSEIFAALESLPLSDIEDRRQADELLADSLESPMLRGYLLQNLEKKDGRWRWRMNLPALSAGRQTLFDFPECGTQYLGPALFIYGGNSDYVKPEYSPAIHQYFPYARERAIAGAGHWVYAEQPDTFIDVLTGFFQQGTA